MSLKIRWVALLNMIAWVIMPDHLHALLWWGNPELTISTIMQRIKSHSSKEIYKYLSSKKGFPHEGTKVWQTDFYDFNVLPNREKIEEKANYIHMNPVRNGLVNDLLDYRWSSAREFTDV